jgi:hypothetical protein
LAQRVALWFGGLGVEARRRWSRRLLRLLPLPSPLAVTAERGAHVVDEALIAHADEFKPQLRNPSRLVTMPRIPLLAAGNR